MDPQKARRSDLNQWLLSEVEGWPNPNCASRCPNASTAVPHRKSLIKEIAAWEKYRNKHHTKADWRFTTDDARIKLKHLYPSI